jgi:hypothetical protein
LTRDEFVQLVGRFRRRALPGRNLYVWCGSTPDLEGIVGSDATAVSLLDLLSEVEISEPGRDQTKTALEASLRQSMNCLAKHGANQSIALVQDLSVLAYYRVAMTPFYDYYADDTHMTVLCAGPAPNSSVALPALLKYDCQAVQNYFRTRVGIEKTVEV